VAPRRPEQAAVRLFGGTSVKVWRHIRDLWPRFALVPVLPFWGWAAFWLFRGQLRWEHLGLAILVTVLAYWSRRTKRLFLGLLPLGLVALIYDAMRFVKNAGLTESGVHLCDLRNAEIRWFGLTVGGVRVSLQDWFQAHHTVWLDLVCAVPYAAFLSVVLGYAIFLLFKDFVAQQRFAWGFAVLNVAGFLTYHVYPAAPPWYYHLHGCAVDLQAAASAGPNLTRVDELLEIRYFAGFYGRASDVFGAMPSLHVAYPLLMVIEGWSKHRVLGRTMLVLFYGWMCFSAVYLDHHWVLDLVAGSIYAVAVAAATHVVARWVTRGGVSNVAVAEAGASENR
jgi:inositol phosphorylceramide synthase catalytic subunit